MAQRRSGSGKAKQTGGRYSPTRGTPPGSPEISNLDKFEASEGAIAAEPSRLDAMGKDKRREVIGHSYGPSRRSQLLVLGGVLGTFAVLIVGGKLLADSADTPPATNPDRAPWSKPDAPQVPAQRPQ